MSPYLEPKRGHLSSSDTFHSRSSHEEFHSEPLDGSGSNNGISPGQTTSSHRNSWQEQMENNARMHYLQTFPVEESMLSEDRDQLAMEYRRQSTLPTQRSVLQEQYRALPLRTSVDSEAGGKPRSFTLPRDSGLHAILAATAAAADQREPQHYHLERPRDTGQTLCGLHLFTCTTNTINQVLCGSAAAIPSAHRVKAENTSCTVSILFNSTLLKVSAHKNVISRHFK